MTRKEKIKKSYKNISFEEEIKQDAKRLDEIYKNIEDNSK